MVGGKTRLLRPHSTNSIDLELSIAIPPSNVDHTHRLLESVYEARKDKDQLNAVVKRFLSESPTPFDLTSLASHREVLLLREPLRVTRIKKMIEINGLIQVSKENLYFQSIPNFSFRKLKRFPLSSSSQGFTMNLIKYKLKNTGVELQFSNDSKTKNLFILFDSTRDRDLFINTIQSIDGVSSDSISSTLSLAPQIPPIHIVTDLWRNSYISNFAYLMYLNFMAGRSANDIGQYPVLPWTINEMTASSLDLSDAKQFRDLSVPIAATNKAKLDQAIERSAHMPLDERFLFGSFYSNPAFVLYFLIRKFPECHLRLHGGHFDHSARLFSSLKISWNAVAVTGSAMMELIPEFYSEWNKAKEWLTSSFSSGNSHVGDVSLPPWVPNGDPSEFVIRMRCALESAHVSAHLHEWIDLVFGVKSTGKQICFDAKNLFHPICYLTDVDGDVIRYCKDHETTTDVVVLQSQEFGHVPKQLFVTEPHPPRIESRWKPERSDPAFYRQMVSEIGWRDEILIAIETLGKSGEKKKEMDEVSNVKADCSSVNTPAAVPPLVVPTMRASTQKNFTLIDTRKTNFVGKENIGTITDFANVYGELCAVTSSGYFVTDSSAFRLSSRSLPCIVAGLKKSEFFCASADGDVFIVSSKNGRIFQKRIHENAVTVIDIVGNLGVSGSTDQSILVWDLETLSIVNQLDFHSAPISCIHVIDSTRFASGDTLGGIACWDLSRPSPLVWTSTLTRSRSIKSIVSSDSAIVVFDSSNSMVVFDTRDGVTLWDHSMGGGDSENLLGGFFPNRKDSSIMFVVSETKEGTVVHNVNITWANKAITNFSILGSSVIPNQKNVLLARKPNVDNSITCLSDRTVSVIKKKSYYNFDAFCIHIPIVS